MGDIEELAWRLAKQTGCVIPKQQLSLCIALIEDGVSPEAIVYTLKQLPAALARRRTLKIS